MPIDNPDNWFYRSIAAGNFDLWKLLSDTASVDESISMVSAARVVAESYLGKGAEKIDKLREVLRAKRRYNEATAALVDTAMRRMASPANRSLRMAARLNRTVDALPAALGRYVTTMARATRCGWTIA